ncbi:valine--tRNA ligase [Zavarzinia sp. CC-PAN008]|uniref:valine--tRNA ligase n=1 Tax=Zavarzinia sp. CC-PAN008 TaxID=3243332 RepID=UPI003F748819
MVMDKTFDPQAIEPGLYQAWEEAGAFKAGFRGPAAKPFTIMIPPPNVTGSLHIGHALNNTLQDILIRFERMRGRDALWQPGMDHAGIATQLVVERQLNQQQTSRIALGREAFVSRVWEWKAESGGTIAGQLRRLGASCDWSRERFTMDEGLSRAVLRVFVTLYKQGLIYRDKRLVNWDPVLRTAVSDLEVFPIEVEGRLWHLRYPIEGEADRFITVATTRPETMLGDTGVAVHPEDERYRDLIGKFVVLPLVGRRIPIVGDEHADPEKGSGAVKITPAHDFNDWEVGKRHGLDVIDVMTDEARLNDSVPEKYRGHDRYDARSMIVRDMDALGLLEKIETIRHAVPHDEKSKTVELEPRLTDQWWVKADVLARDAIAAVEDGRATFVPKQWDNTYFQWMRNIQPWCISRQLWWGHQIPAWYGPDGTVFVEESEDAAQAGATAHYGKAVELRRDSDVLDTWFSSALWPFSTLGWPDETPELQRYYPTDVLVTGFDIIFFWVARMMMMGLHFTGKAPFSRIYIHGLIRDEKGQKMSKTKGNVVDPLALIDQYGADALRFTLAAHVAQGRDMRLSIARVEGYRNFATKLWNAARFAEMNGAARPEGWQPRGLAHALNRWIVHETQGATRRVTAELEALRFNEAAGALYQFVWGTLCDWYVELAKPLLQDDGPAKAETQATLSWAIDQVLALLHPFMPFITEKLWADLAGSPRGLLIAGAWPVPDPALDDPAAAEELGWLTQAISDIRAVRAEMGVPAAAKLALQVFEAGPVTRSRLEAHREALLRLARLETVTLGDGAPPKGAVQIVAGEALLVLPLAGVIDIAKERARLDKDRAKAESEIAKIDAKLGNADFVARAPEEVIEEQKERRAQAEETRARLAAALERLANV